MADRPHVRLDPTMRFGDPHVQGIRIEALGVAVWIANGDVDAVADDYGISRGDVLAACWVLGRYGALNPDDDDPWRGRWGAWAVVAEIPMAQVVCDYGAVPDPPGREE